MHTNFCINRTSSRQNFHSLKCDLRGNMEDNAVCINSLPPCYNKNSCICFNNLFNKPVHFNSNDVIQYTTFNLKELTAYIKELESHSKLDAILNTSLYGYVSASEVHKANNHFLETVRKFQVQLLLNAEKGEFYCRYFNDDMNVSKLVIFFEELGTLNNKSIHLFNTPTSPLTTKNLTDILDLHRNCLYIFQQFYNISQFNRPIFRKDSYNVNIHSFQFRK
jgi:hypothetical protein